MDRITSTSPGGVVNTPAISSDTQRAGWMDQLRSHLPGRFSTGSGAPRNAKLRLDPQQRYLFSTCEDRAVRRVTINQVAEHQIPPDRVVLWGTPESTAQFGHGQRATVGCLSRLTMRSKLELVGHGTASTFDHVNAARLAKRLVRAGLKEVGVLKLNACQVGRATYLAELRAALDSEGVRVGYLSGPKDSPSDVRYAVKIRGRWTNLHPSWLFLAPGKSGDLPWIPIAWRTKVVKGNVDVQFSGTRYQLPLQPGVTYQGMGN